MDLAGDSSEHTAGVVGEADVVENEGLVPPATKAGRTLVVDCVRNPELV